MAELKMKTSEKLKENFEIKQYRILKIFIVYICGQTRIAREMTIIYRWLYINKYGGSKN